MMDTVRTTPRIRRLLKQADQLAAQNRFTAAEKIYRDITAEAPNVPDPWLSLARVVRDETEREQIFLHVLDIDPGNQEAKHGLHGDVMTVWHGTADPIDNIEPAILKTGKTDEIALDVEPVSVSLLEEIGDGEDSVVGLRCNKCNKPINIKNSTLTPVGYRCNECVREIESSYFSARIWHYLIASFIALSLATISAFFIGILGFWIVSIFAGGAIGSLIGRFAFRAAGRNRGRYLPYLVGAMVLLGAVIVWFNPIFYISPIPLLIFAVLATSAAYYQSR